MTIYNFHEFPGFWVVAGWYAVAYFVVMWLMRNPPKADADDPYGVALFRMFVWLMSPVVAGLAAALGVVWLLFGPWGERPKTRGD